MSWNTWDISTALFPVLPVVWQSNKASAVEKYLLKTPGNGISETLNFKMSLDASTLKHLFLWCKFQSQLLFIISLLLENFLTALHGLYEFSHKWKEVLTGEKLATLAISRIVLNRCVHIVKEVIAWNLLPSLWLLEQSKEVTLWVNLSWHIRSYI